MLESITFKTELGDILTIEEVTMLFDNISNRFATELVSLSLFPKFTRLRNEIINKAATRRNEELSKLLSEIAIRKRETKVNIWHVLGEIGEAKKYLEHSNANKELLEQHIYEEGQIINAFESSIQSLELKEKKIMSGKYPRIPKIISTTNITSLYKQLLNLKKRLMEISEKHDDCFKEFFEKLDSLITSSVITSTVFPTGKARITQDTIVIENNNKKFLVENIEKKSNTGVEDMIYSSEIIMKDYYQYEPIEEDIDDDLIYQLLSQADYDDEDGTINGLLITIEEQ